ncbi:hypothetical protein SRM_p61033 (plasmid) [Salinibacter ruber M8]|uniref:Uncharacterized protein n=1 Tax=Salinibacter ruber (strain M8) TaxID=761659 RepID=D5H4E9_SALRM|nr:hypothetical protein SRM_p61033 [Salinibacter ruber M8]
MKQLRKDVEGAVCPHPVPSTGRSILPGEAFYLARHSYRTTVYRTTVYRTTVYRTTVYRTTVIFWVRVCPPAFSRPK